MRLTKDEARILADILDSAKYDYVSHPGLFDALSELEERLHEAGDDSRRKGRVSMNDFQDCLHRFICQWDQKNTSEK